jgi:hypothetical protein
MKVGEGQDYVADSELVTSLKPPWGNLPRTSRVFTVTPE